MYLILRHRLDTVVDWVEIDSAVLKQARKGLGLSYEGVARLISVSSKTYERWEKAGRIPRADLPNVAAVLRLQIEEPAMTTVTVAGKVPPDVLQRLEAATMAMTTAAERIVEIVERLEGRRELPPAAEQQQQG